MPVTINEPDPIINVTVTTNPPATVVVKPVAETKIVQVQPGTIPGPKGDGPERSIYSKKASVVDSTSVVIDAATATTFFLYLESSVTDFSIINWPNDGKSQRIAIYFKQDATGSRNVVNWPSNTLWSYGQYPVLTPKPNAVDCIVFDTFDGGVTIFGGIVGIDYS